MPQTCLVVTTLLVFCGTVAVSIDADLAVQLPRSTLLGYSISQWQSLINQLADAELAHPLGPSDDGKHATPLTNLYFRLHRQLFASGHLPASEWGRAYPGQTPVGVHDLEHIDLSLMPEFSRASINRFWELHRNDIPANARCTTRLVTRTAITLGLPMAAQVPRIRTTILQHIDRTLPGALDPSL